jgi:cell division protein FtsN
MIDPRHHPRSQAGRPASAGRLQGHAVQRGSTLFGFVGGLVAGLALAAAVAVYLTNAPIPFVNKVQRPTENVQPGADGKLPDPNKPLYGAPATPPPPPVAKGDLPKIESPAETKAAAEKAAVAAAATDDVTRYVLQAGAFKTPEDADAMRARLAMLGLDSRVFPVEQGGTTLYRVRLGPYGQIDDINRIRKTLATNNIDAQVIRLK